MLRLEKVQGVENEYQLRGYEALTLAVRMRIRAKRCNPHYSQDKVDVDCLETVSRLCFYNMDQEKLSLCQVYEQDKQMLGGRHATHVRTQLENINNCLLRWAKLAVGTYDTSIDFVLGVKMYEDHDSKDLVLQAAGEEIRVHSIVLIVSSMYFKRWQTTNLSKETGYIDCGDYSASIVRKIIEFVYIEKCHEPIQKDEYEEWMAFANQYQLDEALRFCLCNYITNMDISKAEQVYEKLCSWLFDIQLCQGARNIVLEFISIMGWYMYFTEEQRKQLSPEDFHTILSKC